MELDPSMLLGFLIQSYDELQDLQTRFERDMDKKYPLVTIQDDTKHRRSSESKRKNRVHADAVAVERGSGHHKQHQPPSKHRSSQDVKRPQISGDHQSGAANKPYHPMDSPHVPRQQEREELGTKTKTEQQQQLHRGTASAPSPSPLTGYDMDDAFSIKSLDSDFDSNDDM